MGFLPWYSAISFHRSLNRPWERGSKKQPNTTPQPLVISPNLLKSFESNKG